MKLNLDSNSEMQSDLLKFQPQHEFFIGIDSDGCVFDSMEVKQKEFFIPNALKYFELFAIAGIVRRTWEFVNLYSIHRGSNRFLSLIKVFEFLEADEDVKNSGVKLPDISSLRIWTREENKLGNDTLRKHYEASADKSIEKILRWSEAVNQDIATWLRNIPPFPGALNAIRYLSGKADIVVISQTPYGAIEREWEENNIIRYIRLIAAQEQGTKAEHIALGAKGKYPEDRIIMIGDAKGDLDAAESNSVLFFPIIPGSENESWERFLKEGFSRFTRGSFRGLYQDSLKTEFLNSLPDKLL